MPRNSFLKLSEIKKQIARDPVHILVVDDQPKNLVAIEAVLTDPTYRLITAASGREALACIEDYDFAVVLLDVQMPDMDGFAAAKKIRGHERSHDTPVIFMTAIYQDAGYAEQGYSLGAVDYLPKPINVDALRAKVAVFVDLFRKNRAVETQASVLRELERREADRQIAAIRSLSEEKYRRLVEGIQNGLVWSMEPASQRLSFISPHVARLTGHPLDRFLTQSGYLLDCIEPEDRKRFADALEEAERRCHTVELEHRLRKSDGTRRWLKTSIRPTLAEDGRVLELNGLSVDVTELHEAILVRDEFLSIAAHELKTPMTPLQLQIQGFKRLFDQGRFEEVPVETLRKMIDASNAQIGVLLRLIDQLLDFSRLAAGSFSLQYEDIDLSELLRRMLDLFADEIASSHSELELDIESSVRGRWDPLRIEQVIINLLSNAVKYGAGRTIRVRLGTAGSVARLVIEDQGIGIDKPDQERVFKRFERAVSSRDFSGAGLGLFIAREIVLHHGGAIRLESELGRGSCFTVELPLEPMDKGPVSSGTEH